MEWADFRIEKNNGWTAKFYAKRTYEKETRREELSANSFRAYYVVQSDPIVVVVSSDGVSGLEIRISRFDNESYRQKAIWIRKALEVFDIHIRGANLQLLMQQDEHEKNSLRGSFLGEQIDMRPVSLSRAMKNFLLKQAENSTIYMPSSINFRDSENGTAEFKPDQRTDELFAAVERQEAVERYLSSEAMSRKLSLKLLESSSNSLEHDVKVAFGGYYLNEFRTDRSLKPVEYEYIKSLIGKFI